MQLHKMEIGAVVTDKRGKMVLSREFVECHCLLKQFAQLLHGSMSKTGQTIKGTDGADHAIAAGYMNLWLNAGIQTNRGIVIGSGHANAVTMTDYKLENQMVTNLAHAAESFALENPSADVWRAATSRGITNNTGAQAVVEEVALYTYDDIGGYYCIDRTLYHVTFEAGETLTLTYRIPVSL